MYLDRIQIIHNHTSVASVSLSWRGPVQRCANRKWRSFVFLFSAPVVDVIRLKMHLNWFFRYAGPKWSTFMLAMRAHTRINCFWWFRFSAFVVREPDAPRKWMSNYWILFQTEWYGARVCFVFTFAGSLDTIGYTKQIRKYQLFLWWFLMVRLTRKCANVACDVSFAINNLFLISACVRCFPNRFDFQTSEFY